MPTEQQVAAVVLGLVNAALPSTGNVVRAYDASTVPVTKPAEFVVVSVARRPGGDPRAGRRKRTGWSVYLMAVSQTSVTNARNSLRIAGAAIEFQNLTAAGATSTPVDFYNQRPVAPDDGWFSGAATYNFAF